MATSISQPFPFTLVLNLNPYIPDSNTMVCVFLTIQRDEIVTEDLQKQVVGYYEYLWFRKKGVTDDSLINSMPLTFHAEVSLSGNKYILDKVSTCSCYVVQHKNVP